MGWQRVMFTCECDPEGEGWCQIRNCAPEDCDCIGPTEEDVEYEERDGVLYGHRKENPDGREDG
jgi:hypothetical protein